MKKEKSVRKAEFKAAVIRQLKSLIVPAILCVIILIGVLVVINYETPEDAEEIIPLYGYEGTEEPIIVENGELKLTMDPLTTQFSLEVKDTGKVWYSNPQDAAEDTVALTAEKGKLQSTLALTYSITTGLETTINNYTQSTSKGIYEIESGEDYITVHYSMGDVDKEYVIPPVTTATRMEALMENMDKTGTNTISQYYKKYDINNLGKKDDKEALLASYPIMETEVIYVLRDTTKDNLKLRMEELFAAAGYTYEDYQADKELNFATATSDKPVFNLDMTYRLDGGDLVVEIPMSSLENKSDYPIYTITPLPYFGAGGTEDEGYILVPEGGGGIINFNNGKVAQNTYFANMYGWDMGLSRKAVVHSTRNSFNTFGIAQGNDSFLCILEEGAPYASVQADISGRYNSYNYANAVYSISVREQYDVGEIANSAVYTYLEDLPDETLTQRYRFIDSGSYVDMAKDYQGYLKEVCGEYLTMNDDSETPVAIEIVAAVDKVRQIVGIPVSRPLKLTSYSEAEDMIEELKAEGMNNMSVKLMGWSNGGVKQKILNSVKTISALGSKKDLQSMVDTAAELGVDVYLDGVTNYAYNSSLLQGFFSFTDAAKFLSRERAELYEYSDITYAVRDDLDTFYLLDGDLVPEMIQNLSDAAGKYGAGVSFRDVGMDLSSDYDRKNTVSRQEALNRQVEKLKAMADAGQNVMINSGNEYAAVYSDMVTNMDLKGSEYTLLDASVPFYQIALHGYVNYTGEALNICGNTEEELLNSAEYGAGLYFTLMRETAFALQKTLYTEYYASDYAAWHDRMMEIYTRYNEELGHTFNQEITNHEKLSSDLSCTTYADGTKVYVNYGYAAESAPGGVEVPARDYKVVR